MIQADRVKAFLKGQEVPSSEGHWTEGAYVVYWMQSSQRVHDNHALAYAIDWGNRLQIPVVVYFGLYDDFPGGNLRHFAFMLEGLQSAAQKLRDQGMEMVVKTTYPPEGALHMARKAALLVMDRGYLRVEKTWRQEVIDRCDVPVYQVETNVVLPVERVSHKEEYAAHTIRKKIHRALQNYLVPLKPRRPTVSALGRTDLEMEQDLDLLQQPIAEILEGLQVDRKVPPVSSRVFQGGEDAAHRQLEAFIDRKLAAYPDKQSDAGDTVTSELSPYLHFGQISPLKVALRVYEQVGDVHHPFLEQLIVRRELAMNFVYWNEAYDSFTALPDWAQKTLNEHRGDPRDVIYTLEELVQANTYDRYFNAAQRELMMRGTIHNYMRMYWGKKIIEWSPTPEEAFKVLLQLNDEFALDGRDPNGYTNILWCFGKHDRPFQERQVLGKVRYMSEKALKRNGDPDAYVERIQRLWEREGMKS